MQTQHTLFNKDTFETNEEFKLARACQIAMNKGEEPTAEAQAAYDTVITRLQSGFKITETAQGKILARHNDSPKLSESDAEEKLERIIQDETYRRQQEANSNVSQCAKRVGRDQEACTPSARQMQ